MPCSLARVIAVITAGQWGSCISAAVTPARSPSRGHCRGRRPAGPARAGVGGRWAGGGVRGEDGGGDVPGDAPPERGGLVLVGQLGFGGGLARAGWGRRRRRGTGRPGSRPGSASAGRRRGPGRPARRSGSRRCGSGVDRRVDLLVEADLGAPVGGGLLPRPGGAGVLLGDTVSGAEHHQVGQQFAVLRVEQLPRPCRCGRRCQLGGVPAYLGGGLLDQATACGQVPAPPWSPRSRVWDAGQPGRRPGLRWCGCGWGPGASPGRRRRRRRCRSPAAQGGGERGFGVMAVGGEQGQVAAQGGPGGGVEDAGGQLLDVGLKGGHPVGAE